MGYAADYAGQTVEPRFETRFGAKAKQLGAVVTPWCMLPSGYRGFSPQVDIIKPEYSRLVLDNLSDRRPTKFWR